MKIGLVSAFDYSFHGGVTDHIRNLASQLEAAGNEVVVFGPCSDTDRVPDNFVPMGRPVPIPSNGSIARVSVSVWLSPRIKQLLNREAFDIIHLHEPFSGFVPLNTLSVSETVNVATFHSYRSSHFFRIGGTALTNPYFRRIHGLIAVSKPARDFISQHFPGDYRTIPNGIQLEQFAGGAGPFPHLRDGMINLLFLGRLEKRKGLKYLLSAFSRLKWDWPNLRLIVVGPGKPDDDSYRIMSERNLRDVVFVGGVSEEEKVRYFRSADIYCSPATGRESFGIVLLEAMAAGRPIVATSIEGHSSVMTDGREGLLVPPKDDEALANAIDRLIRDPGLRERLAANGAERVQRFRWEKVAGEVMDYYVECLEASRVAALP